MARAETERQVQKLVGIWRGESRTHPNDRFARTRPEELVRTLYIRRVWQVDGAWKADAFYGNPGRGVLPVQLEFFLEAAALSLKFRDAANNIVNLTLVSDTRLARRASGSPHCRQVRPRTRRRSAKVTSHSEWFSVRLQRRS